MQYMYIGTSVIYILVINSPMRSFRTHT